MGGSMTKRAAPDRDRSSPKALFADLEQFGDAPALVAEDGRVLSYAQLADDADTFGHRLGRSRKLILIEARNTIDTVVAYVGALRQGHVVMLAGPDYASSNPEELKLARPDWIYERGSLHGSDWSSGEGARPLHPDLALVLPTSGSTGNAKLVRLSAENLASNAASICEYLQITQTDRAITSLPLGYSYGLSILNSHLMAGARLLITDRSVIEREFWDFFRREEGTSLAGVPYTYDLLEKADFRSSPPPTLRYMTQAGGRLGPELVEQYARCGDAFGFRFFVMYGQTEASPRMAYLPPENAQEFPTCIGVPVPGGSFHLEREDGTPVNEPNATGELVYRGPNVMMGYASATEDLGAPAGCAELRTGDLAERTEGGLFRIVGRASRFLKLAGIRVGLDDVENFLANCGTPAWASGTDARIVVCVEEGDDRSLEKSIATRFRIPLPMVRVVIREVPRLASGKVDYPAIRVLGDTAASAPPGRGLHPIEDAYRQALGVASIDPDLSFAALGGDSLCYVAAACAVEEALGTLPANWENMSVRALETTIPCAEPGNARRTTSINMEILWRVLALSLVILDHGALEQLSWMRGGSLILFGLAGYNIARFQRGLLVRGEIGTVIGNALRRIILPYYVLMLPMLFVSKADWSWGWFALVSTFTVDFRGPLFAFWFIETVFHALLITAFLFVWPRIRKVVEHRPLASAWAFLGGAVLLKMLVPLFWTDGKANPLTVDAWLYAYAIGAVAYFVQSRRQKTLVLCAAALLSVVDWGLLSSRPYWFTLAFIMIVIVPPLNLPRFAGRWLSRFASDSYFIYLAHVVLVHFLINSRNITGAPLLNAGILLGSSVVAGVVYAGLWSAMLRRFEGIRSLPTLRGFPAFRQSFTAR